MFRYLRVGLAAVIVSASCFGQNLVADPTAGIVGTGNETEDGSVGAFGATLTDGAAGATATSTAGGVHSNTIGVDLTTNTSAGGTYRATISGTSATQPLTSDQATVSTSGGGFVNMTGSATTGYTVTFLAQSTNTRLFFQFIQTAAAPFTFTFGTLSLVALPELNAGQAILPFFLLGLVGACVWERRRSVAPVQG